MSVDLGKYLSLYVAEAGEHLAAFARDLVVLEDAARTGAGASARDAIDSCFRHAHSVKGMSGSMQLDGIGALAHRAEDLVDVFRRDPARLDAAAVDVLLAAADALQEMVQAAATGANPAADPAMAERLAQETRRLEGVGGDRGAAPREPPPPAPARAAAGEEATRRRAEPPPGARGLRRVPVEVEIAGSCPVPAVRAFLVVKKLAALGAVASARPPVDDLRAGRIPGRKLAVQLDTSEPLQAVERALAQIADISAVTIREPDEEPAPAAAPAAAGREPDRAEASRTVRVRTEILDGFLDAVGELILATARIREVGKTLLPQGTRAPLDESVDRLHAIVKDLHDKVMAVRMTPLALVTERLPRAARDVARKLGKQVEVEVRGAEIELDRAILEELSDPLLHVLRNAVDHGIEPPQQRVLAGKPATGKVVVQARRERSRVIVEISDDGKGMDPARLRAAAVAGGALTEAQATALGDREALLLACLPGLSTAGTVTDVSGRGVGLDAVKRTVDAVGGTLELESAPGAGSRITFRLPLTLAVQPVLLVRVCDEVLGLPIAKVHGAAQVELSRLDRSRGAPVLAYDGDLVPVHDLTRLLGFPRDDARDDRAVVVAEGGDGRVGLAVDALLGQQEAVLKPLGVPLDAVPGLSAVTVLGNGRPVFILDVQRLLAA
ncbi:MAG TPA: chemotaxis protein CheA [Anaeromyxobacter sp.]|nr:chemotaxis protein CheA [Anaeromyxobacter sp.]